jgi:hypothetical protein
VKSVVAQLKVETKEAIQILPLSENSALICRLRKLMDKEKELALNVLKPLAKRNKKISRAIGIFLFYLFSSFSQNNNFFDSGIFGVTSWCCGSSRGASLGV